MNNVNKATNKSLFITLGWSTTLALSSMLRHGLIEGDEVLLITPHIRDEQANIAVQDIRNFVAKIGNIAVREVTLDLSDFIGSIASIKKEIDKRAGRRLIVILSGGMRGIILATYIACCLTKGDIHVELEAENRQFITKVPVIKRGLFEKLGWIDFMILQATPMVETATQLREYLGIPMSTFHKHIRLLEEKGLIMRERSGKGRAYKVMLTELGKLLTL